MCKPKEKEQLNKQVSDEHGRPTSTPEETSQLFQGFFFFLQYLFTSLELDRIEKCIQHMRSSIIDVMNAGLTEGIERAKIEKAIFSMNGLGSPGPDGFSAIFYQEHWDIVGS